MLTLIQSFISFFFKPIPKKKAPKVAPSKRKRGQGLPSTQTAVLQTTTQPAPTIVLDDDSQLEGDAVDMEIAAEQDEAGVMDEGKSAHDEATVSSVKGQAIEIAKEIGIRMTPHEEKLALGLFPKVF